MEVFARDLSDKTVVNSGGTVIGELHNVTINYNTGDLESLLVVPEGNPTNQQVHKSNYKSTDDGYYMIPAELVQSVKDQIVVE